MSIDVNYNFKIINQQDFKDGWREWTLQLECEKGLGQGLAVLLRHIIIAKAPSYAVKAISIRTKKASDLDQEGFFNVAAHDLCSIDGLIENIDTIIGNISNIIFVNSRHVDSEEATSAAVEAADNEDAATDKDICLHYRFETPGVISSFDLNKQQNNQMADGKFISADNNVVLCNLDKNMVLDLSLVIGYGNGYVEASQQTVNNFQDNVHAFPMKKLIHIDTCYSCITKVRTQVNQLEQMDQVQIHVESAKNQGEPMEIAKDVMYRGLGLFANCLGYQVDDNNYYDPTQEKNDDDYQTETNMANMLAASLDKFAFNPRVVLCLQKANIYTLSDLTKCTLQEIGNITGIGKDGCQNIVTVLQGLEINLS